MSDKLIKCDSCDKEIAKSSDTCPHCGATNKYQHPFLKKIIQNGDELPDKVYLEFKGDNGRIRKTHGFLGSSFSDLYLDCSVTPIKYKTNNLDVMQATIQFIKQYGEIVDEDGNLPISDKEFKKSTLMTKLGYVAGAIIVVAILVVKYYDSQGYMCEQIYMKTQKSDVLTAQMKNLHKTQWINNCNASSKDVVKSSYNKEVKNK